MRMVENHIRELRLARGWSQEQLAKKVAVTRWAVAGWERQEYQPSGLRHRQGVCRP